MSTKHRFAIIALATVLVSCAAKPGPAPVENVRPSNVASTTQQREKQESRLSVGIDPLTAGLNPHLLFDANEFVNTLAQLVLPSAFEAGKLNGDLLEAARPVSPPKGVALSIRYDINPEAQWSDGTPITVADFEYLRNGIAETPGALDAARYRAISNVRSANGGRTVYVDFEQPIGDWQSMFQNLLPSHVLGPASDFATALNDDIPASGWRLSLSSVDRGRGVITLHRNDRYWGTKPAQVETVQFVEVRSLSQATELLRSGQLSFVDMTPTEVAKDTFGLIPHAQVRTNVLDRRLQLSATPSLDVTARKSLASMIDPEMIARLATGRSSELDVPASRILEADPTGLLALGRPIRLGVDPSDSTALAATRAIADILDNAGVDARVITSDSTDLLQRTVSDGDIDAIVAWTPAKPRDMYHCDGDVVAANISTYCDPSVNDTIEALIAGQVPSEALETQTQALESEQFLNTVLLRDVRLQALGKGIVGPNPDLQRWPVGLSSLADWSLQNN
ncbi:ABC transporter family substrate-binding protein [Corynebacterium gerontici]|uniref:Putative monoacyl phosphatidylinositol tetramannoside-binding protein LpqW n=1 Tax=Corynebacterium gerontici TaxID=2079234 RepID=A0A3G6IZR7_9CORY|nr:ABC transporter family substrate-binding protein [Corynebacterium gerontici]AZA11146.1 putative monoacyl phosphatidylinositol tetramannoside-binding protein LpqW precursor [Corynebacterium gerontici]